MESREEIIRLSIAGDWTASDMAKSFLAFNDLYNIRIALQILHDDYRELDEYLFELYHHFPPFRKRLKRRRIDPLMFEMFSHRHPIDISQLEIVSKTLYPHEVLKVRRVKYESPGFKDLTGLGEIVGHVKDATLKLIEWFGSKEKRRLSNEEQSLKNQAMRIENARSFVALAKECGYQEHELRQLVNVVDDKQETIIGLIADGKLKNIKMLNDNNINSEE